MVVLLSACSSNKKTSLSANGANTDVSAKKISSKALDKSFKHMHVSNPCTAALAHSHLYENKEHKHRYDCESTNEIVINGHKHPATKNTRKFRHVHPNGANEHTHNR